MTAYYAQCQMSQAINFATTITEWNHTIPIIYTPPVQHLPMVILPSIIAPICPYIAAVDHTIVSNATPQPCINVHNHTYEDLANYVEESVTPSIEILNYKDQYSANVDVPGQSTAEEIQHTTELEERKYFKEDLLESYLKLPKELFPTAKMLSINPNPIINEFCAIADISENVSWILDLEFGVPRAPITRAIATYDVKFNSVHCKNTPNAIHPGFEKCSKDFKRVILFYYDCIVSNWYNGYTIINCDVSIENFQSWLLIPMQVFGMCWP